MTVVGLAADNTDVESVRIQSSYAVGGGGITDSSLNAAFTLKRLLVWWQFFSQDSQAAPIVAQPYGNIAVRVGGARELVEFGTDAAFLAQSNGLSDQDSDWLMWNPVFAMNTTEPLASQRSMGNGFIDNRGQRRCDEPNEDILIFKAVQNISATQTSILHVTWAALCDISR